jgi:anti-anti-sigma regulatory factor
MKLNVERIGDVAIVRCDGRIVRGDAALRLRDVVTAQHDARIVLLDLSSVEALEGGGLGMLVFLDVWTRTRGIQLKIFDPPDFVRQSLDRTRYAAELEIASMGEVLSMLGWEPKGLWNRRRKAA